VIAAICQDKISGGVNRDCRRNVQPSPPPAIRHSRQSLVGMSAIVVINCVRPNSSLFIFCTAKCMERFLEFSTPSYRALPYHCPVLETHRQSSCVALRSGTKVFH
jgi:hypothetical protein